MRTKTRDLHPQDFSPEEDAGLLKLCKTNATTSEAQSNSLKTDGSLEDAAKRVALTAAKPFLEKKLEEMGVSWETVKAKVKDIPDEVLRKCVRENSVQPLQPYLTVQHLKATKSEVQTNPYCVHINESSTTEKIYRLVNNVHTTTGNLEKQLKEAKATAERLKMKKQQIHDKMNKEWDAEIAKLTELNGTIEKKKIDIEILTGKLQSRTDSP